MEKSTNQKAVEIRWKEKDEMKNALYGIIKEELRNKGGKFEIEGELWDGTEISYIKLNADNVVVINGIVSDITSLLSAACVEDLLWIAEEICG